MAIRHIREAFNQAAEGHASCSEALLRYEDNGQGGQHQIITIKGVRSDGTLFNVSTPAHAMQDDPHHHVRKLAEGLKEEPISESGQLMGSETGSSPDGNDVRPSQLEGGRAGIKLSNPFSRGN